MSKESSDWLNNNVLVGFTAKRGNAWHWRQGTTNHYEGAIPTDDVRARLFDWEAVASPVYVEDASGEGFTAVPGKTAYLRSDNRRVMGVFSEGYQGHGYAQWLIDNVSQITDVSDSELGIASAGLLKGGAVAWVQIEMAENVDTTAGISFRPFLLATTSFDGTVATQYKRGAQFVVCDNTLSMALGENGGGTDAYKLKHTKYSDLKLTEAREALEIIYQATDEMSAEIKRLTETTVTDDQWTAFLDAHAPVPETAGRSKTMATGKREALGALWLRDERVSPWKNTAMGVLQAVNTFATHEATVYKGVPRAERIMENVIKGKMAQSDRDAMATLTKVLSNA